MRSSLPSFSRRRPVAAVGFTLIELLVVISIIVILIGILVPVVGKVREKSYEASTRAEIGSLSAVITQYFQDHRAYPGIVNNAQLRQTACNITGSVNFNPAATWTVANMSMNENVFLSLCGGLQATTASTPAAPQFEINRLLFGQGAKTLGTVPKKINAYTDLADAYLNASGNGKYSDDDGTPANDTLIPEFVDRFPGRMPLLILRARAGTPGVATASNQDTPAMQYDLDQVASYTVTTAPIGVGRKIKQDEYKNTTYPNHGLRSVSELACIGTPPTGSPYDEHYPYDLYAALLNPNTTRDPSAGAGVPGTNTVRQKDAYILISAGIDRVYGTADDITNFGKW